MALCLRAAPVVTHTDQVNAPGTGGISLTLSGVNFGESDVTPTVQIMTTVCDTASWSTTTGLVCDIAGGSDVGSLLSVRVSSAALTGTATGSFTYDGIVCGVHVWRSFLI